MRSWVLANITYDTPALNCGWDPLQVFLPSVIERSLSHTRSVLFLPLLRAMIRGKDLSPRGRKCEENRNNITLNIYKTILHTPFLYSDLI